jgi:small subunit ribosomal protein S1
VERSRNNPSEWSRFSAEVQPGNELDGIVRSLVAFGAFVEVAKGVEGLVHSSESDRQLNVGERLRVRVLAKDDESRRLSLTTR